MQVNLVTPTALSYSQSELFPVAVIVTAILTVVIAVVVKATHCANAGQCLSY